MSDDAKPPGLRTVLPGDVADAPLSPAAKLAVMAELYGGEHSPGYRPLTPEQEAEERERFASGYNRVDDDGVSRRVYRKATEVRGRFAEDYDGQRINTGGPFDWCDLEDLLPAESMKAPGTFRIVVEFEPDGITGQTAR
jgi:hypothetical protein